MTEQSAPRRGLKETLTRQLLAIAVVVILVNVGFVALFDAADRDSLMIDLTRRELLRLERSFVAVGRDPVSLADSINGIYDQHSEAYAFAVVGENGTVLAGKNTEQIPPDLLRPGAFSTDWLAWPFGTDEMIVVASHTVSTSDDPVSLLFFIASDPADLLGKEVADEFFGHVWLPIIPIAFLLIGGTLWIIHRALRPVTDAALWARRIRPGQPLPALETSRAPAEIHDLTDAVKRSIERLDAELSAEQRRAAEAAHALRTPVAVLVARLHDLPDGPKQDVLRDDVRALARTVTQFLSSAGADRLEVPDSARLDLSQLAEQVVGDLYPLAEAHACELVLSGHETATWVHGLGDAVGLALTNLIENAIQHAGSGVIEISVGPGPTLSVRDHGPGLDKANAATLFEPFRRGHAAPRGGAGLGLSIVERVQRAHRGKVEVDTPPDGGTVFSLIYRAA